MHWADEESGRTVDNPVVATGEAPSGNIHLGHIRELLTGEAISRTADGELILIVDSIDPLRKVYPFLDDSYEEHKGKPLSQVPCPCGEHDNYAEHFMDPFLDSLEELGVELSVKYAHEMYADGDYEEATRKIIEHRDHVADIIETETGRELKDSWFPYTPLCSSCGRLGEAEVTGFEDPYVLYSCGCGNEGKADIRKADGKLPWRCDWPARWWILGIDCEPFGKDHAASGGSWDTGKRIIDEVFERGPPHPVIYEWIQLKGEGPMSSSSGVSVSTEEMLNTVAPEVLRFMVMRSRLKTHIDFDPGLGILDLVDEYDEFEREYYGDGDEDKKRVYELSQVDEPPEERPQRVPYRHLVNLVQIYDEYDMIWEVVVERREISEPSEEDLERMKDRATRVEYWLENFAPDMVKFSLQEEIPDVDLSEDERGFLERYLDSLRSLDEWSSKELHTLVHKHAEALDMNKGSAFGVFYKILLDQKRGPRLGRFLMQIERDLLLDRIEASLR